MRETEAEAVAFIVGQAIGLEMGNASSDYIQMYNGNATLLAESLEVIQRTSAVILAAIRMDEIAERRRSGSSSQRPANAHILSGCAWECARLRPHARFNRNRRFLMTTTVQTQSEYRDLPLDWLVISPTNPRKKFDEDAMQELAASIRENGVLQPLLVRPRAERSFEIVVRRAPVSWRGDGRERYRAGVHPRNDRRSGIGGAAS